MQTYTINGTYGSGKTPCTIFVCETRQGHWYVVEGSTNVNCCYSEDLYEGVDVDTIDDYDYFSWNSPIESEEELEAAVES